MDLSIIAIVIASVALLAALILLALFVTQKKRLDHLTKGITDQNLQEVIRQFNKTLEKADADMRLMNNTFDQIRNDSKGFFRKIGLVRFSAFNDVGGDQSFALALLDENDNGFVISSMLGRDISKVYAKKIEQGVSTQHSLTDEEQSALNQAQNK